MVVISVHIDAPIREQLEAVGIKAIIAKPFEAGEVIDAMEVGITRRRR